MRHFIFPRLTNWHPGMTTFFGSLSNLNKPYLTVPVPYFNWRTAQMIRVNGVFYSFLWRIFQKNQLQNKTQFSSSRHRLFICNLPVMCWNIQRMWSTNTIHACLKYLESPLILHFSICNWTHSFAKNAHQTEVQPVPKSDSPVVSSTSTDVPGTSANCQHVLHTRYSLVWSFLTR